MLTNQIQKFFGSLTDNTDVVDLATLIQEGLEQGHTAIEYHNQIDSELISEDGSYGYIVINNKMAGFRRFFNQERNIYDDFNHSEKQIEIKDIELAIKYVCHALKIKEPSEEELSADNQWIACTDFLIHQRYILSGGPGTGKTTTVIRMILMFKYFQPNGMIALAAPTGKAANRMIQSCNQILPIEMRQNATTLHRLLGYDHHSNKLKYNHDNKLPHDLIIIDEASMLDVSLTNALIQALKPSAQLILIGDKNQLPAVDSGNVFANLIHISKNNHTELIKNYRFNQQSSIAVLCKSIIEQDRALFKQNIELQNPNTQEQKLSLLKKWYESVGKDTSVILSPINYGNNSVSEFNQLAQNILYDNKKYSHGMPIIINHNDYVLDLFNGDIGFMHLQDNKWYGDFSIEGKTKLIPLDAIQNWQQANAITIHKSQGSEYDHVLIILPSDDDLKLLTNALLYTAISRAKKSINIWSEAQNIEKIIKTKEKRKTFINYLKK